MNTNLALQKPTTYNYQKLKHKRKTQIKPHKNNSLYSIITIGLIVISSYFITYNFYVIENSKDLYFAIEYNFTQNNSIDKSLLRVKYMNLITYDKESAQVEVSGLSKSKPHHTISLTGDFTKDSNNSWQINKIQQN